VTMLRVLGPLEVVDDAGGAVVLAPRGRRLLASLTVRADQVATTDWLIDAVWGAEPPVSPEAALQTQVSRLRTALRSSAGLRISTQPNGYRLEVRPDTLDIREWQDLLSRSRRAKDDPVLAANLLDSALALWRGPAYGELGEEGFAQPEASRLAAEQVAAIEELAELRLATGDAPSALAPLTELVRLHPFRERPVQLLMLALHRLGRTAEALQTLESLRSRLGEELGLDPSPELETLQRQILRNDPRLAPPPAPVRPGPSRLVAPLPAVPLIGRVEDRRELATAVRRARLVTVTGPGGVGKTSLAAAVLVDLGDAYADGSVAVELSRIPVGSSVSAALGTVLQVPGSAHDEQLERVVTFIGERELLVVLDNCEHVLGGVADLVRALLRGCPRLSVLATSRIPLRLPEEEVFALRPLEVGAAEQLFLTRARQRVRGFDVGPDSRTPVVELCVRLDGLPLALELAASQMDAVTPAELLGRLGWRLTVLRGGPATDPRHRSLGALVDWSFERLSVPEQQLFEIVSVFAGEFGLDQVEGVVDRLGLEGWTPGEVLPTLRSLVEQSMVTRRAEAYVLLETLRTYGRQRLAAGQGAAAVHRAHAELFTALAADGYDDLYGAGQLARVGRLERSTDELRAAYRWGVAEDLDLATELVGGLAVLVEHKLMGRSPTGRRSYSVGSGLVACPAGPGWPLSPPRAPASPVIWTGRRSWPVGRSSVVRVTRPCGRTRICCWRRPSCSLGSWSTWLAGWMRSPRWSPATGICNRCCRCWSVDDSWRPPTPATPTWPGGPGGCSSSPSGTGGRSLPPGRSTSVARWPSTSTRRERVSCCRRRWIVPGPWTSATCPESPWSRSPRLDPVTATRPRPWSPSPRSSGTGGTEVTGPISGPRCATWWICWYASVARSRPWCWPRPCSTPIGQLPATVQTQLGCRPRPRTWRPPSAGTGTPSWWLGAGR